MESLLCATHSSTFLRDNDGYMANRTKSTLLFVELMEGKREEDQKKEKRKKLFLQSNKQW